MKVLHVTNNFPTAKFPIFGIFVKEQIDSLSALGVNNTVFFINGKEKGKKEYFLSYFKLLWHLITNKYDLIHCHHSYSALIFIATLFPVFKKCVLSFQNDPSHEINAGLFYICHLLFSKIILKNNSEVYMQYPKCIYFPNGVNLDIFKPLDKIDCAKNLGLDPKIKYILFFDSNKGKRTQKRYDRFKETLTILKSKKITDIEEIVLTNTPRELIPLFMNVASLHLLCSDFEGSPNSVKECMACNTKVVSTDVGNVKDLFVGTNGYFVSKTMQPEELADLVEKALSIENIVGRSNIIEKNLDLESVAKNLKKIYINLLE